MHLLWQLYPLLILQFIKGSTASCTSFCACRWKNGKQTVECANKNVTEIPDGMDPETQVLDFSGNKLGKLTKDLFLKKQLINLQRVYLSECRIKSIHRDTFKGLTNLVELDLSKNLLENTPSGTFTNCPSLMKLMLNSNPINSIKKLAFNHLSYLNTLELSDCGIAEVEEGAFQGLHSLEWLHLDGNRLRTIPGERTLPETLKGVHLQKNNWECDCHIQELSIWLKDFKIPLSEDPTCNGPPRLSGRVVKSIPKSELACLPDVSPTSFYLELGEGKNVSLLCHVHAIPEATVSWWFQGQMLQNNTMVAPGLHLIYYIEEGAENKRSELFIYNANAEDNGTFICNADNAAGTTQSNFTIRIILKENPIVIIVSFPLEYLLIAVIGISILGVIIVIVIVFLVVRCLRKKKKQKKMGHYSKNMKNGDNLEGGSNNSKPTNVPTISPDEGLPRRDVESIEATFAESSFSPSRCTNQLRSPILSVRQYQMEQNPDIIDGTDGVPGCRREGDGEDQNEHMDSAIVEMPTQFPVAGLRGSSELYGDGRCIVDTEGYPVDYGLPKMSCRMQHSDGFYRTLPTNRMKRHTAANPIKRFSREAEFLSRSVDAPYDYRADVRYTADGYPARPQPHHPADSYPEAGVSPASMPYCRVQWPSCVPANLHVLQASHPNAGVSPPQQQVPALKYPLTKRSASAQTDTESETDYPVNSGKCDGSLRTQNDVIDEVLVTESPDEGYVGEPSIV